MDLVSIIIPVYNSFKYISKCLDSVVSQTYTNLEIIVIDDGSTDESSSIIEQYKNQDDRLVHIKNTNHGVSYTRNCGLSAANGKYVTFVDSDDTIEKDYIEKMLSCYKENDVQLVICDYMERKIKSKKMTKSETLISMISGKEIMGYCWNKMYLNHLIKIHNIKFDENIYVCEDFLFNVQYFNYIDESYYLTESLYNYVIHSGSALTKKMDLNWLTNIDAFSLALNDVKHNYDEDTFGKYVNFFFLQNLNALMKIKLNKFDNDKYLKNIKSNITRFRKVALKPKNIIDYKSVLYYYFFHLILLLKKILRKK